jgi:hypothetical protein
MTSANPDDDSSETPHLVVADIGGRWNSAGRLALMR